MKAQVFYCLNIQWAIFQQLFVIHNGIETNELAMCQ